MRDTRLLPDIQALRALAILSVLLAHLSLPATLLAMLPGSPLSPFWIGVELFFVISGFIVTKTIAEGSMDPARFVIRRAFRLLPAMLLFVALSALAVAAAARFAAGNPFADQQLITTPAAFIAESASILLGYFINRGGPLLYTSSAMWSLSVEFQFYAVFAALLACAAVARLSPRHTRRLIFSCAAAVYALALWQRAALGTSGAIPAPGGLAAYITSWKFDFMALGVLCYAICKAPWPTPARPSLLAAAALALTPIIALLCEHPLSAGAKPHLDGIGLVVMGWCFALAVVLAGRDAAFASRGAGYRLLGWVGNRSYSLYLVHYPLMALIWVALLALYPAAFGSALYYGVIQAGLVILLAAALSDLSYRMIELPGGRLGGLAIGRFMAPSAQPAPAA